MPRAPVTGRGGPPGGGWLQLPAGWRPRKDGLMESSQRAQRRKEHLRKKRGGEAQSEQRRIWFYETSKHKENMK